MYIYIQSYAERSVKLTLSATRTGEKATLTPCVSQPSPAQLLGAALSRAGQLTTSQTPHTTHTVILKTALLFLYVSLFVVSTIVCQSRYLLFVMIPKNGLV